MGLASPRLRTPLSELHQPDNGRRKEGRKLELGKELDSAKLKRRRKVITTREFTRNQQRTPQKNRGRLPTLRLVELFSPEKSKVRCEERDPNISSC